MAIALLVASALTVVLAGVSLLLFPPSAPLEGGWFTPIIAFELARVPADLAFLSGADAEPLRAAMDAGHRVDRLFPFAYGGVLVLSGWVQSDRWGWLACASGVVAIGADLWENQVLIALTALLRAGGTVPADLLGLPATTWTKWGAIGVALAALGMGRGHAVGRVVLLGAGSSVGVAALTGWPLAGEAMALLVVLGLGVLGVRAVVGWRRR